MTKCELCKFPARSYCESDEAYLCWGCDVKVHGANFLVARHTRTLLCRNCYSLTPWKASGPNLGHTVSVCHRCVSDRNFKEQRQEEDESEADNEDFSDSDDDLSADDCDGDGGGFNGENQVVPLSPTSAPPGGSSSSCTSSQTTRRESSVDGAKSVKRMLQNDNTHSSSETISRLHQEIGNSGGGGGEAISVDSSSPLKEMPIWVNSGSRSASNIKNEELEGLDLSSRRNVRRRIEGRSL